MSDQNGDPASLWRWDSFYDSGIEPPCRLSDHQWQECKRWGGNLADEARRRPDIVISQAVADREDREATLRASMTRKQLTLTMKHAETYARSLEEVAFENVALSGHLKEHIDLVIRAKEDALIVAEILAAARSKVGRTPTGPDIEVQHRLTARIQHVLARYGKSLSTSTKKAGHKHAEHWPTFLKIVMEAAGIFIDDRRAMTLIRREVGNKQKHVKI